MQQSALGMERTLPLGASLDEAPTTQGEKFWKEGLTPLSLLSG